MASVISIWKLAHGATEPERKFKSLGSPWPDRSSVEVDPNEELYGSHTPKRTNLCLWFCAIVCILLTLATILAGFVILILYLSFEPKMPHASVEGGRLLAIDPQPVNDLLSMELWFFIKFSNPSKGTDIEFQYVKFELYYLSDLLAVQMMLPFVEKRQSWSVESLGMVVVDRVISPKSMQAMANRFSMNHTFEFRLIADIKVLYRLGSLAKVPRKISMGCTLIFAPPTNGTLISKLC